MKFIRYQKENIIRPGILAGSLVKDLSPIINDISPDTLNMELIDLAKQRINKLPTAGKISDISLKMPISESKKLICIGFNSKAHVENLGLKLPKEPFFFLKASSSLNGPYDNIIYPKIGKKVDWEAELAVIIGKKGKYIKKENALKHIFGYCMLNEVSERYWQFERNEKHLQLAIGKSFDSFAPIGPYIVTKDELTDPYNLSVVLKVNNKIKQDFNTSDYIYGVEEAVSYCSQFFTLYPGDIISMGSGPGTGIELNSFLQIGDKIHFKIDNLGIQENTVIEEI
ncbi:MAG TPA: fumarylacetoacetate hydrolase family protein [Victivallales bacterium]|nr:fumarylacetoacetate hydrolase family protein [Victivallales bacterium]